MNIANINILVRFNKTREILPSITRVLSILLTTAATSANVDRVNSKERVPKILCSILAASYRDFSTRIQEQRRERPRD